VIFVLGDWPWAVRVAYVGVKRLSGMVLSNEVLSQPLEDPWKGGEWMTRKAGVLFRFSTRESRQESLAEGCSKEDPVCK
jgi:hypothetical protein